MTPARLGLVLAVVICGGGCRDASADPPVSSDARECWERNPAYPGDLGAYLAGETWCSELTSRFDGAPDVVYVRFPPGYDPERPVPVLLYFRAMHQSEAIVASPTLLGGVAERLGAIVVGVGQRGGCSFLGDYRDDPGVEEEEEAENAACRTSEAAREAAKRDVLELTNQISSRFLVSHFLTAGASMGGYVSLRLATLYPRRISGVLASAPALCAFSRTGPPWCDGPLAAGSAAIYEAAEAGVLDDQLVWMAVGTRDEVEGLLAGNRALAEELAGAPHFHYAEVEGAGHESFLSDDYNARSRGARAWLVSNPAMPTLEEDLRAYLESHPAPPLRPDADWSPPDPSGWYLTQRILELGRRRDRDH